MRRTRAPLASRISVPLRVTVAQSPSLEIGDAVGEGAERERVRAQIHGAVAVADGERRALARAAQQILLALEQIYERERAAQPREGRMDRVLRRFALGELVVDHEGRDLGIGLGREDVAFARELLAQRPEILDDAVVDDRKPGRSVRMGVGLGRLAVRRPAGGPMPIAPPSGAAASFASRFLGLPSARRRSSRPFSSVATPAES
jgi:hypothetical protein